MMSKFECNIREKVSSVLAGRMTLRVLQNWLAPQLWDIEKRCSSEVAQKLGYAVELALAEYSVGHLSRHDLITELEVLISGPFEGEGS